MKFYDIRFIAPWNCDFLFKEHIGHGHTADGFKWKWNAYCIPFIIGIEIYKEWN